MHDARPGGMQTQALFMLDSPVLEALGETFAYQLHLHLSCGYVGS